MSRDHRRREPSGHGCSSRKSATPGGKSAAPGGKSAAPRGPESTRRQPRPRRARDLCLREEVRGVVTRGEQVRRDCVGGAVGRAARKAVRGGQACARKGVAKQQAGRVAERPPLPTSLLNGSCLFLFRHAKWFCTFEPAPRREESWSARQLLRRWLWWSRSRRRRR